MSRTGNAAARNGVSSAGVTFAAEAESDEIAAQQATLAQPTITPEKAAAFIPFTFEIEGDYPNFANEMQRLIETAYIDFVGEQTAVGAAGVIGIFTALTGGSQIVNPTTDGLLGPEDAFVVWQALPERARSRASWFMNVSVESQLRQASSTSGLYTVDMGAREIFSLLGKRVLLSDYAPSFSGTTGSSNLARPRRFQLVRHRAESRPAGGARAPRFLPATDFQMGRGVGWHGRGLAQPAWSMKTSSCWPMPKTMTRPRTAVYAKSTTNVVSEHGLPIRVTQGEALASDDPVVEARPDLFSSPRSSPERLVMTKGQPRRIRKIPLSFDHLVELRRSLPFLGGRRTVFGPHEGGVTDRQPRVEGKDP